MRTDAQMSPLRGHSEVTHGDRRFPRSVYGRGTEPDPRFSLANERTFLAWIRTALALLAAGVALEALDVPEHAPVRLVAAMSFVVLALLGSVQAWSGWLRTERALREHRALPAPSLAVALAAGVFVAVGLVAVGLVQ